MLYNAQCPLSSKLCQYNRLVPIYIRIVMCTCTQNYLELFFTAVNLWNLSSRLNNLAKHVWIPNCYEIYLICKVMLVNQKGLCMMMHHIKINLINLTYLIPLPSCWLMIKTINYSMLLLLHSNELTYCSIYFLIYKGPNTYKLFINCLKEETEIRGHRNLTRMLTGNQALSHNLSSAEWTKQNFYDIQHLRSIATTYN